jgi:hypothetical protein
VSSPTFRARQTIKLAGLGTPVLAPELGDGGQGMQALPAADKTKWLLDKVSTKPAPGSNVIFVTHVPNITGAFPTATGLKDGEALILRPQGNGQAELVARVTIEEWPLLAK